MPAGAEGGTGRDGVAGARPFRAETFHNSVKLYWVFGTATRFESNQQWHLGC